MYLMRMGLMIENPFGSITNFFYNKFNYVCISVINWSLILKTILLIQNNKNQKLIYILI